MGNNEEHQDGKGFKVQDRRRFTDSGDARDEAVAEPAPADSATEPLESPAVASDGHAHELNFSTFVLSLSTQALAHLGEIPDPFTKQTNVDLGAARQMIDIIGMLQEKTRNNLDATEAQLMQHVLYDLRLRFVERSKK